MSDKPWTKHMERVAVIPWPGIDGAYLCLSARKKPEDGGWSSEHCEPNITFTFDNGDVMAEWDGEFGPLQLWFKCDEDYEYVAYEGAAAEKARRHWLYPFAVGSGHWGQQVVGEHELPAKFLRGNYEYIFNTLRWWASDREDSYPGRLKEASNG